MERQHTISFFVPSLQGGGAERVMVSIASGLAELGYRVEFVTADGQGPYRKELPGNIRLVDLQSRRVIHALPKLVRFLRDARPAAILATLTHANVIAVLAAKLFAPRTRIYVREANTLSRANARGNPVEQIVLRLARIAYRWADGVIAPSRGVADDLLILGVDKDNLHVIYNPVIDSTFKDKSRLTPAHPWFHQEPPVILGVGRLTPQKDFSTLIKAFRQVRDRVPAKLVILGEGEQRDELMQLSRNLGLEKEVDFPGFAENPFAFMAHASVFVLSSMFEGLPNVLIQALAAGTPVVSTDCPSGPREILRNGEYGRLVPMGDHIAMATAILQQMENPIAIPDLASACARYDRRAVVSEYEELLIGNREAVAR